MSTTSWVQSWECEFTVSVCGYMTMCRRVVTIGGGLVLGSGYLSREKAEL